MNDEFPVSSAGAATSVPVLTRDGEQILCANAIGQAVPQGCVDRYGNQMYGTMPGRAQ
jgi:hypothetical protein